MRPVVLRTAADVVERLRVVRAHAIELRQRQVGEVTERREVIEALVEAAVVADQDVLRIERIEDDIVVVEGGCELLTDVPVTLSSGERRA